MAFLSVILLISCQTKEKTTTQTEKINLNGNWEYLGFGRAISFKDTLIKRYHISTAGNVALSDNSPKDFFGYYTVDTVSVDTILLKDGVKTFKLYRTDTDYAAMVNDSLANDPEYNFEVIWSTFNEQYCYFKERKVDWDAYYQKYRPQITPKTTPIALYLLLEKMLNEIGDGHISINLPDELEEEYAKHATFGVENKEDAEEEDDSGVLEKKVKKALIANYVKDIQEYNRGDFKWGAINEEVGYLQFSNMIGFAHYAIPDSLSKEDFWGQWWQKLNEAKNYHDDTWDGTRYIMDSIAGTFKDKKAIVIDLRFNGGGFDEVSVETLNHFAKQQIDFCTKKARRGDGFTEKQTMTLIPAKNVFEGNLYILTSHLTASAAELLTLGSKVIPNSKIIGSTTEGVFSDVLRKKLPNGWIYGLSNLVYESMQGVSYENIGIAPDVTIDYPRESKALYEYLLEDLKDGDQAIEKVLAEVDK